MTATIQILLLFLTVLVAAALIARRLNTAPSIVLVIAGVLLALTPGLPGIELAPEFVLLVILPPLIYSAGVSMSWREFRFNLRPITLLAFGCVVFTAGAVAVAAHYVLGFSWAVGFLLGAIVAPPDVVAPLPIASATRLQGIFFWDLVIYLIEGFVFLLTGLQARTLFEQVERFALRDIAVATLLTTAIVIAARFAWVFPATYLPRWLSSSLRKHDPSPPWQQVFVLASIGVRGVVSLAAALAIPLTLESGARFPDRDRILFITFGVIMLTLVGLGLSLPAIIRWLGVTRHRAAEHRLEREAELAARYQAMDAGLRRLEELARERDLPDDVAAVLRARDEQRRRVLPNSMAEDGEVERATLNAKLRLELIATERQYLHQLLRE